MSSGAIARATRVAGAALLTALGSCRDLPTQPNPHIPGIVPGQRLGSFVDGAYFGLRDSPGNASYDGVIDKWDGSAPPKPDPTGVYYYPTIVAVTVAGTLSQVPGDLNQSGQWGPLGLPDHQAAIGAQISTGNGGAMYWPATTNGDTVKVSGTVHGLRAGFNDPQPEGDWWWTCGDFVSYRDESEKPCWTFEGTASMIFTRVPVDLTLALSLLDSVDVGMEITFTAGMTHTTIAGKTVDMSALEWRWEPDLTGTSDTTACTQTSGATCTRTITGSGTIFVTAYVNGQQQERSQYVGVIGKKSGPRPPCATGFPELDDPVVKEGLNALWADSKPDGPLANRRERAGFITFNNSTGKYGFVPATLVKPSTLCSIWYYLPGPPGTIRSVHTHPYGLNEPAPVCKNGLPLTNSDGTMILGTYPGGYSDADVATAGLPESPPSEFIMDRDEFVHYDQTGRLGNARRCPN